MMRKPHPGWCRAARVVAATAALFATGQACTGKIGGPAEEAIGTGEFACESGEQDPGPSLIRRLTNAEYIQTVRDSLGVDIADLEERLPVEQHHDGFVNAPVVQVTAIDHVEAWAAISRTVVERLGSGWVAGYADCATFEPACIDGFIDKLGLRLMRRPPEPVHRQAFAPLFAEVESEGGSFEQAAGLVLRAMLQSPWFLYRVESQPPDGTTARIDDHELASRLSYLFWGTSPDDELYAAVADGVLSTEEGLRAQIDRMLASDRARSASQSYLGGWLFLNRLKQLTTELSADYRHETEAFFDKVVWEQRLPLTALFTAEFTVASERLAAFYQLEAPQPGVHEYDLTDVANRRGLLTQASMLTAGGVAASFTFRGKFLLNHLLCTEVPDPPPGVNDQPPPVEPGKSQRYYSDQRIATDPCGNCHGFMEPLAHGFAKYDGFGAWQEIDAFGNELRTDGRMVTPWDAEGKSFADANEFIDLLVAEPRLQQCLILKLAQFSLGRSVERADGCTLEAVQQAASSEALTYQNVLRAIALQPSFRMIRGD